MSYYTSSLRPLPVKQPLKEYVKPGREVKICSSDSEDAATVLGCDLSTRPERLKAIADLLFPTNLVVDSMLAGCRDADRYVPINVIAIPNFEHVGFVGTPVHEKST